MRKRNEGIINDCIKIFNLMFEDRKKYYAELKLLSGFTGNLIHCTVDIFAQWRN